MAWKIYNVDEDHHNPGPHVKEGWSFKLNGKEFVPETTDWSEGWANLIFTQQKSTKGTTKDFPVPTDKTKKGTHDALWQDADKKQTELELDAYQGTIKLAHNGKFVEHLVKLSVVHLKADKSASRAIMQYGHGPVVHGTCTHGDD